MTKFYVTVFLALCRLLQPALSQLPQGVQNFTCGLDFEPFGPALNLHCSWAVSDQLPTHYVITYENSTQSNPAIFSEAKPDSPPLLDGTWPSERLSNLEYLHFAINGSNENGNTNQTEKVNYCALFGEPILNHVSVANVTESSAVVRWEQEFKIPSSEWTYGLEVNASADNNRKFHLASKISKTKETAEITITDLTPETEYDGSLRMTSMSWSLDDNTMSEKMLNLLNDKISCKLNESTLNRVRGLRHNLRFRTEAIPRLVGSFVVSKVLPDAREVLVYWPPKRSTLRCDVSTYEENALLSTESCENDGVYSKLISNKNHVFLIVHKDDKGDVWHRQNVSVPERNNTIEPFPMAVRVANDSRSYTLLWRRPSPSSEILGYTIFLKKNVAEHYEAVKRVPSTENSTEYVTDVAQPTFAVSANSENFSSGMVSTTCILSNELVDIPQLNFNLDFNSRQLMVSWKFSCAHETELLAIQKYTLTHCRVNSECDETRDRMTINNSGSYVMNTTSDGCHKFVLKAITEDSALANRSSRYASVCVSQQEERRTNEHLEIQSTTEKLQQNFTDDEKGNNDEVPLWAIVLILVTLLTIFTIMMLLVFQHQRNRKYGCIELHKEAYAPRKESEIRQFIYVTKTYERYSSD